MTENSTQQLILEAIVTCIEKYGVENTTTRKIAAEAGTNIASINYYFRSKDVLIGKALEMTLNNTMEDFIAILRQEETTFVEILRNWFVYMLDGAQRYPNVVMAHMYTPLVEKRVDTIGVITFRKILDMLVERATEDYPRQDPSELRFVLVEIISAMIFKLLAPGFFQSTQNLPVDELADRYVSMFSRALAAG